MSKQFKVVFTQEVTSTETVEAVVTADNEKDAFDEAVKRAFNRYLPIDRVSTYNMGELKSVEEVRNYQAT